ncbi:hypothetical protein CYLTODRAFT_491134 [Cylindrobasidium torrendii FP15055 ss-10]|uniref:F-box domain-containing protein n=1 Tax=Cylindrobasidium torrendii FP15055 ss-10 TaxID=1314674 RepID=A0A0D7B9F9_9AGAR|nr:hypothetical protein CYLTODRAFT_491134 [Cylindrobasidium torrendii FP15055 ss-10]
MCSNACAHCSIVNPGTVFEQTQSESSPFQYLLNSTSTIPENAIPRQEIREYLGTLRDYQKNANASLSALRRALRAAEAESLRVRHKIDMHARLIAPINTLPSEILALIFHIISRSSTPTQTSEIPLAIVLTRVCRRWEIIAYDTALLWNSWRFWEEDRTEVQNDIPLIVNWLSLSRGAPVYISLFHEAVSAPTLKAIDQSSLLIRHLQVGVTSRAHFDQLADMGQYPNLEHFEIDFQGCSINEDALSDSDDEDFESALFDRLKDSESLRTFVLKVDDGDYLGYIWQLFNLPWHSLTHLELHNGTHSYLEDGYPPWLRQCVNLVSLKDLTAYEDWEWDFNNFNAPENMPRLEHLEYQSPHLLPVITAPALRSIVQNEVLIAQYRLMEDVKPRPPKALSHFLKRSGCTIRNIMLTITSIRSAFVFDPKLIESMEELTLILGKDVPNPGRVEKFVRRLARNSDGKEAIASEKLKAPNLRRINLVVREGYLGRPLLMGHPTINTAVADFVAARWELPAETRLASVKVTFEVDTGGELGPSHMVGVWNQLEVVNGLYSRLKELQSLGAPVEMCLSPKEPTPPISHRRGLRQI